jgi:4-oxalocrotonate tautomerase
MPLINVKLIEGVFNESQKKQMVTKLTDAMVAIEGEAMRQVTWVVIDEVKSWPLGARRQAADHGRRAGDASQQSRLIGQIVLG